MYRVTVHHRGHNINFPFLFHSIMGAEYKARQLSNYYNLRVDVIDLSTGKIISTYGA